MKQFLFIFFFLFAAFNSFSQDKIHLKDGSVVYPKEGSVSLSSVEKKVRYNVKGEFFGKSIKFKDFDYAILNSSKIKYFEFRDDKNKVTKTSYIYSILIETEKYKLISMQFNIGSMAQYLNFILDENDKIIEKVGFCDLENNKNDIKNQNFAIQKIREYFKDNKTEMDELDDAISTSKNFTRGVLKYFQNKSYRKY